MNSTTASIVAQIEALQNIQKRNRMDSPEWQSASDRLAPLFAEMARRQRANDVEPDWREWTR